MADLPSLDLVRSLTDETVLRHLMAVPMATRAEIAASSGISKTTISESMRRLATADVVVDTGRRSEGRGRAGSYYALAAGLGAALVVEIAPDGIVAETVTAHGTTARVAERTVARDARPAEVRRALAAVVRRVVTAAGDPIRLAVVSAADPVDRETGAIVHLPDAPFLVGEISPADTIEPLIGGPVRVDNDVNWAAVAERRSAAAASPDDFAYVFLGEGVGCAVVSDGTVVRGHRGLAGEIAHVLTIGPGGAPMGFTDVFARLDLRQAGSTAIDVARLLERIGDGSHPSPTLDTVATAIAGVLAGVIALVDPGEIVLGGPWGTDTRVVNAVRHAIEGMPRCAPVRGAFVASSAPLVGARLAAVEGLQAAIVASATGKK